MAKKHIILLTLILALGVFFRLYMIKEMPAGLFPDEAAEGLDAQNINKGLIQPFYERGNGREALFYFMIAPVIKIWGSGVWQLHAVSAVIGILSILGLYLMAARLYNRKTALLAAFLMAVGTWHIVLSRTAFRANLIPLFITFTIYFITRTIQAQSRKEKMWSAIFAGAFLAGGFYSYIAYRIIIAILGFIAIILLIADARQKFKWIKEYYKLALTGLASFLVVFAPLGYYFLTHPGSFVGRSSQVSVFNSDLNHGNLLGTIWDVFTKSIFAFFQNGDLNWRHNISGLPFLPPIVSPFFGIALLLLSLLTVRFIYKAFTNRQNNGELKHVIVIGLFWGMLLPVITTAEGIPHGLRSIGMVPSVYLLSAIGLTWFAHYAEKVWHYRWMEKLYWLVAICYFATLIFLAYSQYFSYAKNSWENYFAFRGDLTTVSKYLNESNDKERTFLVLDLFSVQTVDFLTAQNNHPYIIVDPANSTKLKLRKDDKVVFTTSTLYDANQFMQKHRNLNVLEYVNNGIGQTDMIVFQAKSDDNSSSLSFNYDKSFWALNLGDKVYWSWENQSFYPWKIKIWQCESQACQQPELIKENNQNDYFANNDHQDIDATKSDLYYKAAGIDASGKTIKEFGIIKVNQYK